METHRAATERRATEGTVLMPCTVTSQQGKSFSDLPARQQRAWLWCMPFLTLRPMHPLHNY